MNQQFTWWAALALSALLSACASTPGAKPEDMSAKAHEEQAVEEAEIAQQHAAEADASAGQGLGSDVILGASATPAEMHSDQAERHLEHAKDHLAAAEALKNAEEDACKAVPEDVRESCPLLGPVVSTEATTNGARITVREGTDMQALLAQVRCHIAVGNTHGRKGMEHCPLYVRGVHVRQVGPNAIELTTSGKANIQDLQERVADHIGD